MSGDNINLTVASVQHLVYKCHSAARAAGWWPDGEERNVPTALMLCVSELSEAMEAHRKGIKDSHLPHRDGLEVELADLLIRVFRS